MKKIILLLSLNLFLCSYIFSQSHNSTQAHQAVVNDISKVTQLGYFDTSYFTVSEDGFIIKWTNDNQGEHYQITDVGIKLVAVSPSGNEVAIYESDGGSVNKVSVWNWKTLTRIKQFKYNDSVTSLAFSAKGTYLIIGTATVDGAVFIRTSTWTQIDKINTNTSIVNYIQTSNTEKTCMFYSPIGNLSYFNLGNGQLKQKLNIPQGLSQCTLYNNNIFFAGVRDDSIYIINAYKGNTVSKIQAQNPLILSDSDDSNLYYLEYDGKTTYELKMLENMDNQTVSNPRLVKTFKGPRGNSAINTGIKNDTEIVLGSKSGSIYKVDSDPSSTVTNMTEITENIYAKIYDICSVDSGFYFLTKDSIFKSSYTTGIVDKLSSTSGQTQITPISDNQVILWSIYTKNPVILLDLSTTEETVLFTPKNNLTSIKYFESNNTKYIVDIESNSNVNLYNFNSKSLSEMYTGTGIQDAILNDDGLFIAKSAATNPKSPLLYINPQTYETVPLTVKGNVAYGLSFSNDNIYGINLSETDSGETTFVFSYNSKSKQITNILKFANEDAEAFTYFNKANLFTNIGKNKIYCYNINTKKIFSYNRSASIPKKVCQNNDQVVILNNNGSISWCNNTNSQLLADWYLTNDNQWYEF